MPPSCFTTGTGPYDAVRVTLHDEIDYFFQPGTGGATRSAIAAGHQHYLIASLGDRRASHPSNVPAIRQNATSSCSAVAEFG